MRILVCAIALLGAVMLPVEIVHGQIFVGSVTGTPQDLHGAIGEYNFDGSVINPALTGGTPIDISIVGSNMFVINTGGEFASSYTEYTTGGATVTGSSPFYMMNSVAASGSDLFIGYPSNDNRVAKCTLTGDIVNDSFITGL